MSARCRTCNAEILWVKTREGRPTPLDATPDPGGNIHLTTDGVAHYLSRANLDNPLFPRARRYTSHFATCPDAATHRKKPASPA